MSPMSEEDRHVLCKQQVVVAGMSWRASFQPSAVRLTTSAPSRAETVPEYRSNPVLAKSPRTADLHF